MSIDVIFDRDSERAVLVCNTTGTAFGPVFTEIAKDHDWSAGEVAEKFLEWLPMDARELAPDNLADAARRFAASRPTECGWYRCKKVAAAYSFDGTPNKSHSRDRREYSYCSGDCSSAHSEDAHDRFVEGYYGASTPQTEKERGAAAAAVKKSLG
jgi:hypothetical protein